MATEEEEAARQLAEEQAAASENQGTPEDGVHVPEAGEPSEADSPKTPPEGKAPETETPVSKENTEALVDEINTKLNPLTQQFLNDPTNTNNSQVQDIMKLYARAQNHHHYLIKLEKSADKAIQDKRDAEAASVLKAIRDIEQKKTNITNKYDPSTYVPSKGAELEMDGDAEKTFQLKANAPYEPRSTIMEQMMQALFNFLGLLQELGIIDRLVYYPLSAVGSTALGISYRTVGRIGLALTSAENTGGRERWEALYKAGMELDSTWAGKDNPYALENNTFIDKLRTIIRMDDFGESQIPPGMRQGIVMFHGGEEAHNDIINNGWAHYNRYKAEKSKGEENSPVAKPENKSKEANDDSIKLSQKSPTPPQDENAAVNGTARTRQAPELGSKPVEAPKPAIIDKENVSPKVANALAQGEAAKAPEIPETKNAQESVVSARIGHLLEQGRHNVQELSPRLAGVVPPASQPHGLFAQMKQSEQQTLLAGVMAREVASATLSETPKEQLTSAGSQPRPQGPQ